MIKYQVRSKDLIDLVNEVKSRRLIMSPYFQRNLVWRQLHKVDFIKTILLGYPFPQIFIAKGSIDLNSMINTSCIVDGQQRTNAICEYVNGEFPVDGLIFNDLDSKTKEAFLKYQVHIIDLDINNEDPEIIEIFKRLNRTFYALSAIEKMSTEFAASEFMLVAKFLIDEVKTVNVEEEENSPLQYDKSIPKSFIDWAGNKKVKYFDKLLLEEGIFTPYEISRQVHLMYTLNIIATYLVDFYNRNEQVGVLLEEYSQQFAHKDFVFDVLERSAAKFLKLKLKKKSYWLNKANAFSILCLFAKNIDVIELIDDKNLRGKLDIFESDLPGEYSLAAKEGVNNKKERLVRHELLFRLIIG